MTTISPKRKRGRYSAPLIIGIAFCALLIVIVALWRGPVANLFWRAAAPAVLWRNTLGDNQNALLRAELASTTAALADRNALYDENVALKNSFGRTVAVGGVLAGVLLRPPQIPYDTLIIDAGKEEGIEAGDSVSAGGTALIGEVSEVYDTQARVTLYSAPGQNYQAFIKNSIPVSIEGQGAGSMSGSVPAGTAVAVGDPVTFPGIAGGYAGAVSHIDSQPGQSFETLYVQLPVDIFSLQFVMVNTHTP